MTSPNSLLCVLLDLSPSQWHLSAQSGLSLQVALSQILVFLNSHIALKHENALAVYGAFPGNSVLLYSSAHSPLIDPQIDSNTFPQFKIVDSSVVDRITAEFDRLGGPTEEAPSGMVACFTKALCYINRLTQPTLGPADKLEPNMYPDPRILILSVSPDLSTSYISIMNAIFSAQKLKVTIDVCQLFGPDTVFFQQAAHLTNGSYASLESKDALLQHLMMSCLSPPSVRSTISVPTQETIDLRAACFCHKNIIDVGFVCSVCLSIFCAPIPVCSTCRTKFPLKTLQRLNASRMKPATPKTNGRTTPQRQRVTSTRPSTPSSSQMDYSMSTNGLPNSNSINPS